MPPPSTRQGTGDDPGSNRTLPSIYFLWIPFDAVPTETGRHHPSRHRREENEEEPTHRTSRRMTYALFGGGYGMALVQAAACYYLPALVMHVVVPKCTAVRPLPPRGKRNTDAWRDAKRSLVPVAIKAAVWKGVEMLHRKGVGKLYDGTWSWMQAILTWAALDLIHDTWFYWAHRLLHWRPLYKHVHYIHHESRTPNAFTGYSFHWFEAVLVFLNEVSVVFLFPIHTELHRVYHMFTTLIHIGGHVGYEVAPYIPSLEQCMVAAFSGKTPCKYLNTVLHHDMHHRFPSRHFSLYFTHWDQAMGTMHESYRDECKKITATDPERCRPGTKAASLVSGRIGG